MAPPTSCSGAYRMYRMLQHAWSLAPKGVTTPVLQQLQYGYQYDRKWNFSSLSWSARCSTTCHHRICETNASSLPPPSAISFDHQTPSLSLVPVHAMEIEHLLLLDHAFGKVFLHMLSTWFVLGHLPSQTENVFHCLRHQPLASVAFRRCVQIFLLTYLLVPWTDGLTQGYSIYCISITLSSENVNCKCETDTCYLVNHSLM